MEKIKAFFAPRNLTQGTPWKQILAVAIPILLQSLISNAFGLINSLILKVTVGGDAVTAISATGSISAILFNFAYGAASGFAVIIGHAYGAKNYEQSRKAFFVSLLLSAGLGLLIILIGFLSLDSLLKVLNIGEQYQPGARSYFRMILGSFVLMILNNLLLNVLNVFGDTISSLLLSLSSTIVNVVFDFVFTGAIKLSTLGVGLSTLISNAFLLVAALLFFYRRYPLYHYQKGDFSFSRSLVWSLLKMGIPLGLQWSILFIGSFIQAQQVNLFGEGMATKATACYGSYEGYIVMPLSVLASAFLAFVAQNHGAGRTDRIQQGFRQALLMDVICYFLMMTVSIATARYVPYLFLPAEEVNERVIFYCSSYLMVLSPCIILQGGLQLSRSSLQGVEKPLIPFFSGIGELVARTLVCLFLPGLVSPDNPLSDKGYLAICFSTPLAWAFSFVFMGGFTLYYLFNPKGQQRIQGDKNKD